MKLCNIHIKNLIILSVSGNFEGFKNWQKVAEICYQLVHDRVSRGLALFRNWRHRLIYMALLNSLWTCMQNSLWRQIQNRPKPFTSSVMIQRVSNFRLYCSSKKFPMLRKNVKSLLQQFQVCIFAEIAFRVRCTLIRIKSYVMPDFETIFFRGTDFPAVQVSLQWLRKTFWILVIMHSKYMNEYKNRKKQCWKRWLISVWNVYKVFIIVAL